MDTLLTRAQEYSRARDVEGLVGLAASVPTAPRASRVALARLVGGALVEALCASDALVMYDGVETLATRPLERAGLLVQRAEAQLACFDVTGGIASVQAAHELIRSDEPDSAATEMCARALIAEAGLRSKLGDQNAATDAAERALEKAAANAELGARALTVRSLAALRSGQLDRADGFARQALDVAGSAAPLAYAAARRMVAIVSAQRQRLERAVASCQKALTIYREQRSPRGQLEAYLTMGICYLAMAELDNAEVFLLRCRRLAENGTDEAPRARVYSRLGHLKLARGEPEAAQKLYSMDAEITAGLDDPLTHGHPYLNEGHALLALDRTGPAVARLEEALTCFQRVGDQVGVVRAHLALARACDSSRAAAHARAARQQAAVLGRPALIGRSGLVDAILHAREGRTAAAMSDFEASMTIARSHDDRTRLAHAYLWLAEAFEQSGDSNRAADMYTEALRRAEVWALRGLRLRLLKKLDRVDDDALVHRSLRRRPEGRLQRLPVGPDDLLGDSPAMERVRTQIRRVASTRVPTLVLGETGTGKELVARAIHFGSSVADGPLVVVNCGAIPEALVEAELFGHVRGAFTGADRTRTGFLEAANGGTVFLDEIGDLPPQAQVKLLRFLAAGEIQRVGSTEVRVVEARVVAATHRDLQAAVADGRFRADLFYRLAIFEVRTPALRDRIADLPLLVEHFLSTNELPLARGIRRVSPGALAALTRYPWPGNVRELENALMHACVLCEGATLLLGQLPDTIQAPSPPGASRSDRLEDVERAHILSVLARSDNNQGEAARRLGIHRNTLRRKLTRP